ncbi:hypothetical protein [Acetobacter indonesiensis]
MQTVRVKIERRAGQPDDLTGMPCKNGGGKVRRTGAQGPVLPYATEFVEGPSQQAAFEMIVEVIETGGQSPSGSGRSMMSFDPCDLLAEQKDRIWIVPFHDVMPPGLEDKHEQNRNTS